MTYSSADDFYLEGYEKGVAEGLERGRAEAVRARQLAIEDCLIAARDGFERAMDDYVLIGPSGMAMQMLNSIKALSSNNSPGEN